MTAVDTCTHEWSWDCECECEHWCWHSVEWECQQYGCDCERVGNGPEGSTGAPDDLRVADVVALAAIGGLAYGVARFFKKRRDTTGGNPENTSEEAVPEAVEQVDTPAARMPPPGWYADGADGLPLRWWDGARWTEHRQASPVIPAGWYDDRAGAVRWWDGTSWTGHVAPSR